ncbi:hypothetical protein ACIQGZ_12120 [Streptomyces sp. NPDC092296]|uniref:hypothetical protein n=1 Tax=Streptomyces sp. NPDC092296 TaxID=3366012 RepID=UPI0038286735
MSERAAPFHCPYCGEEDLRPSETGGHGAWECGGCARAFKLQFLGLLARPAATAPATATAPAHHRTSPPTPPRGAPDEPHRH